ncbi:hypothetical protein SLS53_000724 [Cytospora paraplurivora]|uniref:Uncharacterized protein n=1 Tax=Cytospora paraplurivora TaxID=2898453 RepID=A0AAN9UJE0_9PEZI
MSPPEQRPDSRRRFYFSLFYTVTHVFALLNVVHYWAILVPNGHKHWPHKGLGGGIGGGGGGSSDGSGFVVFEAIGHKNPFKEITSQGWFPVFSLFNLYIFPAIATLVEATSLNSMRRPEVRIGAKLTGHHPFFWMDEKIVGSKEKVAGYSSGFIALAAALFSTLHGLVGMREAISDKAHSR